MTVFFYWPSSHLKAINLGTFDNNILGLAVDEDVAGAGHVAPLRQVDDQEEAGPHERIVELVEVLSLPALYHQGARRGSHPRLGSQVKIGHPPGEVNLVWVFQVPLKPSNQFIIHKVCVHVKTASSRGMLSISTVMTA